MQEPANLNFDGITNRFCEIVAEWGFHFHPDRAKEMYEGAMSAQEHGEALWYPDDLCDGNMALAAAFDEFGVDTDRLCSEGFDLSENAWFNEAMNRVWYRAMDNLWLPRIGLRPGEYVMLAYGDGYEPCAVVRSLKDVLGDPSFLPEDKIRLVIPVTGGAKVYDLSDLSGRLYAVRFRVT